MMTQYCKCGCGNKLIKKWYYNAKYIQGHNIRTRKERIKGLICQCGCGEELEHKYANRIPKFKMGHTWIGRPHSETARNKISIGKKNQSELFYKKKEWNCYLCNNSETKKSKRKKKFGYRYYDLWYNYNDKKICRICWEKNDNNQILKNKARALAHSYIKIIPNTLCQRCNNNLAKERHHTDYSKPLEVRLLCKECHIIENNIIRMVNYGSK